MRNLFFTILFLAPSLVFSQKDSNERVRAFPITSYIVALNDSTKIVQLHPEDTTIKFVQKQLGLLKGIYRDKRADTATIGAGRCNLIKGDYYYFTITYKPGEAEPREGDLIYTMVKRAAVYDGQLLKLAANYIGLLNVYDESLYDYRSDIFKKWTVKDEQSVLDSMLSDIHFTGKYFKDNNPGMNVKIKGGRYDDHMVLDAMMGCTRKDITDFLEYMIVKPRLYAGHEWKIAEIFATWLTSEAPTVIK